VKNYSVVGLHWGNYKQHNPAMIAGAWEELIALYQAGKLKPVIAGSYAMADAANAAMLRRAIGTASSQRRFVAFSSELGPAHRAIARDLGGAIAEMELEAEGERAKNAATATYSITAEDKPRLLLGLLATGAGKPVVVFCDLRDTAEAVAKTLRTRGIRTEYVLGNLPRKRAVHDAVKAGEYDVLVLTDEGASGLTGSWASTLVNWDLPLEGEPYLARLEHLDASMEGARVYNFACERYSYGIPAIERVLGSRLVSVPADASIMAAAVSGRTEGSGRSEGTSRAERADGSEKRSQAQSRPEPRPEQARNTDRKRDDDRRDRGDRSDHGGQYDGRNARAIQADIAAITGGKVTTKIDAVPVAEATDRTDKAGKPGKKRARKGRAVAAKSTTAEGQAAGEAGKRGGEAGRRREAPQPSRAGSHRSKGATGQRLVDPYSVTMEERLRLYRERYGDSKETARPSTSGGPKVGGGAKQHDVKSGRRPDLRRDAPIAVGGSQPSRSRNEAKQPERRPEPKAPAADAPSRGILGAIKSMFGKKDD